MPYSHACMIASISMHMHMHMPLFLRGKGSFRDGRKREIPKAKRKNPEKKDKKKKRGNLREMGLK